MGKWLLLCSAIALLTFARGAQAATVAVASTPGVDQVQVTASSLFSSDATSALASINETAWQAAVACKTSSSWPWITDTTPPYATWISDAYLISSTGTDSWRWFRNTVTVPTGAAELSGTVTWTADNAGLVYVNRTPIGSDGEVFGTYYDNEEWRTIKTYPVSGSLLHVGDNELLFLIRNYGTQTLNPTGVVYEASISGDWFVTTFADVPLDHWAYDAVTACVEAGIVNGYPDGLYHPDDAVKRSQMAVFIARASAGGDAYVPTGPAVATFPDVPSSGLGEDGLDPYWAYNYIEYCAANDIVQGYWNGYHPEDDVSRAQMAVYIARAIATPTGETGLAGYTPPTTASFADVPTDYWAYKYVEYCKAASIVSGYWDGYRPEDIVTRDQMAVYIARAFGLLTIAVPRQMSTEVDLDGIRAVGRWER